MSAVLENHRIAAEQHQRDDETERSMWIDAETDSREARMIEHLNRGGKELTGNGQFVRSSERLGDALRDALTDQIAGRLIEWVCTRKTAPTFEAIASKAIADHVAELVLGMIRATACEEATDEADRVRT